MRLFCWQKRILEILLLAKKDSRKSILKQSQLETIFPATVTLLKLMYEIFNFIIGCFHRSQNFCMMCIDGCTPCCEKIIVVTHF